MIVTIVLLTVAGLDLSGAEKDRDEENPVKGPESLRLKGEAKGKAEIQLEELGSNRYRLGNLIIDAAKGTIRADGKVNMNKGGPIELLACTKTGKRHETIFVMNARPFYFQIALLLLDVSPGYNPAVETSRPSGKREKTAADTVSIDVRWKKNQQDNDAEWIRRPAGKFLYNVKKKRPMGAVRWAFIGSKWVKGVFKADQTGSIIVTFRDPFGVLELARKEVNSDTWFEANEEAIPPVGTPVELIVRVHPPDKEGPEGNGRE